ncbi:MAG TPA: hypothetical protein PLG34_04275 [Spirochaetota bacterium]|jgi:hypothetical protein|nr:MAG: hypothetical protein BWX91_01616 [Spirochaetes bacterium ADurb.Bin133]HPY87180.1 hypothetical protein [Spirochaetota bacterium]HQB60886.1 hypothetical protein [Spirochaetota bacterium]
MLGKIISNKDVSELVVSGAVDGSFTSDLPYKSEIFRNLNLVCNNSGKFYLLIDNRAEFSVYYDAPLCDSVKRFITDFLEMKQNDLRTSYRLIDISLKLGLEKGEIEDIFKIIRWKAGDTGWEYYNKIGTFSQKLKDLVFDNKVSLNYALLFVKIFENDAYDDFLNIVPDTITFSERNLILERVAEISLKNNASLDEIIRIVQKSKENIVDTIYNIRNPLFAKISSIFNVFLKKLKLTNKVVYDKYFENENYKLEIHFKNIDNLMNLLEKRKLDLENYVNNGGKDYFITSNLFSDSASDE